MRTLGWLTAALTLIGVAALPRQAAADSMDPALARFVADESCRMASANGGQYYNAGSATQKCGTYDAYFAKLIAQYGFAVAPTAMHSARTTGYGGFELAIEANYTKIDSDADYWVKGTQGGQGGSKSG